MVSATREINCRTEDSRSGEFILPWKYLEATMLVAVCDQDLGTSRFAWRKMVWPLSLPIWATRLSHSTASKGEVLPSVKTRVNSSPRFLAGALSIGGTTLTSLSAMRTSAISASRADYRSSAAKQGDPGLIPFIL